MMGYTLFETLVVLSIFSILSVSSYGLMRNLFDSNHQYVQANHLISILQYARLEAVRRGLPVIVCGSSDLQSCDGDWSRGQVIKVKEEILRVFPQRKVHEYWAWKSSFGKNHQLEFTPLGFTKGQQGSFYTAQEVGRGYRIVVTHTSIRLEKGVSS